jgi:hypothetical protein
MQYKPLMLILFLFLLGCSDDTRTNKRYSPKKGIISTSNSPFARLDNVPVHAVKLRHGFWYPRLAANQEISIPSLLAQLEQHGVVDNFRRLNGKQVDRRGYLFTDSDLFKWMEAAARVLHTNSDPKLEKKLNDIIDIVISAQEENGYLNTFHVGENRDKRFTNFK